MLSDFGLVFVGNEYMSLTLNPPQDEDVTHTHTKCPTMRLNTSITGLLQDNMYGVMCPQIHRNKQH
jgi:hypothetical protein